ALLQGSLGDYAVCLGSVLTGDSGTTIANNGAVPMNPVSQELVSGLYDGVPGHNVTSVAAGKGFKFANILDGTSNTFLLGEKQVIVDRGYTIPPSILFLYDDFTIFCGYKQETYGRYAGAAFPLALSPNETVTNQFGSA